MNCKQGDLAIIVKSWAGNEGKIVRVLHWVGRAPGFVGDDRWAIDIAVPNTLGGVSTSIQDSYLRPIRPDSEPTAFESHRELEAA